MADPLELGSFLLMLYAAGITLYVTTKAARVGPSLLLLSLLLSSMALFHGLHHLFAYLQEPTLELAFDLTASVSALGLALTYAYVWRRY